MKTLLIANRGEIAIRIARSAADLGLATIAVHAEDDALAPHVRKADRAHALSGVGAGAYLDGEQIIAAAKALGADAIHPGYGFLSENARFAAACAEAGLIFVGPAPHALSVLGDKAAARALAGEAGAPMLRGTAGGIDVAAARAFLKEVKGPILLKAVAGGGGRGMRLVRVANELEEAFARCASEARASFGDEALYAEEFFDAARHVEVQIVGDGDEFAHVYDRECSLQRQRQKIVEIAPALFVHEAVREKLFDAALKIARAARYKNLGTIEFLVNARGGADARFVFIEANPRLQVEHTVTEAITGLDLVRLQLEIAAGRTLRELGFDTPPPARGMAIQARINLETMGADGAARPSGGVIAAYEAPSGPGVRVDDAAYAGYRTSARYDALLAKLIVAAPHADFAALCAKAARALAEFRIAGPATNIPFLHALLSDADVRAGGFDTRFIETNAARLIAAPTPPKRFVEPQGQAKGPGARIDASDPLAVLAHGKAESDAAHARHELEEMPAGMEAVRAPMQGTIREVLAGEGASVRAGAPLFILEAMKLEHVIAAPRAGIVRAVHVAPGDAVFEDHALAFIEETDSASASDIRDEAAADLDLIRPDLAELQSRREKTRDAYRKDAVARRRKTKQRTARENVDDLCDPGSFLEYGALAVAARRRRHALEELIETTPADGLIAGFGRVNGAHFDEDAARTAVLAYDYTVLAGTQGAHNHLKMDRLFELAHRWRAPLVFFTEGGGGRPGDTEGAGPVRGFELLGKLSGNAPFVGINSGRCFAGNASVLGCCDVIIATRNSNIGMGGPAMIEGGGLGIYRPEEIGPIDVQMKSGVVDIAVEDEAAGVAAAKNYLSYFQGRLKDWTCADQRLLRSAIPENRLRAYDSRALIRTLLDTDTFLELRPKFGLAMITGFARVEGRPVGIIANNPAHIGGAIDSDAADKAARLMQICEAYDVPIVSLSDTPGIMVGPDVETTGLVRHAARLFVIGANLSVPVLSIVLRKSYGLGALAMTGGSNQTSMYVCAWPTGEFGGMGLEGSVKLGYRNELAAIEDPALRKAKFDDMVAAAYQRGKALAQATTFTIDDVIDPADTRRWIVEGLKAAGTAPRRAEKKLRWIDAW